LHHAGHATRRDIDGSVQFQLNEYGEYSTKFSFKPGVGLPGRVYASGEASWEARIDEADTKFFERAGGAKVYGVKTALGVPLSSSVVGRIVLAFYSTEDMKSDRTVTKKCQNVLLKYTPEPKWKLVVDMGTVPEEEPSPESKPVAISHPSTGMSKLRLDESSKKAGETLTSRDKELKIASLLGDHMPLDTVHSGAGEASSSPSPSDLLPQFMSLRLLLLRTADRRTLEENEAIDVLRASYQGYSRDNRRSGSELAMLLAKDWLYLHSSTLKADSRRPSMVAKPVPLSPGTCPEVAEVTSSSLPLMPMSSSLSVFRQVSSPMEAPSDLSEATARS